MEALKSIKKAENKRFAYQHLPLQQGDWEKVPIQAFDAPLLEELKSFLIVRKFEAGAVPRGKGHTIPSKKAKFNKLLMGRRII